MATAQKKYVINVYTSEGIQDNICKDVETAVRYLQVHLGLDVYKQEVAHDIYTNGVYCNQSKQGYAVEVRMQKVGLCRVCKRTKGLYDISVLTHNTGRTVTSNLSVCKKCMDTYEWGVWYAETKGKGVVVKHPPQG